MKVLIFEDEKYTSTRLIQLLKKYSHEITVLDVIASVKEGVSWYQQNEMPDLVFQDILLNDGNCFDIFKEIDVQVPVVFTTAYNEYALESFKVNSIDYIVKPYDFEDIKKALDKFRNFKELFVSPDNDLLQSILEKGNSAYKKRFLAKVGDKYSSVKTEEIAWLQFDEGLTFAYTFTNSRFPVNYSIDQLSKVLSPDNFFRINRKYVVNFDAIENIHTWFNSRLKLEIEPKPKEEIIVSRERVKDFKLWLDR